MRTNVMIRKADARTSPEGNAIDAADCVDFIACHAPAVTIGNFALLAIGALTAHILTGSKPEGEVKRMLAAAFRETASSATSVKVGRSRSYEFSTLAIKIQHHPEAQKLLTIAAREESVTAAAKYLAEKFALRAPTVAQLARSFGMSIKSGGHGLSLAPPLDGAPGRKSFLVKLRKLIARHAEEEIPLIESMNLLAPEISAAQSAVFMRHMLVTLPLADATLVDLLDQVSRIRANREKRR